MPLTTTTASTTIREAYVGGFEEGAFRNDQFLGLFGEKRPSMGDTAYRWKIHDSGNNSVEIFTEGSGQPTAGVQSFQNAAVSWTYFRGMVQITGHVIDALKSRWIDHQDAEVVLLMNDITDLMTTSFMGATYGLELAVDYGSSYAGITRNGSAGYFEATETAQDARITTDGLIDLQETCRNADKGQKGPAAWIMNLNQESNIYRLQGPHVIQNSNPADKAPGLTRQTFNGEPIYAMPDWSTTVIARIDRNPGHIVLVEHRPFSVKNMAPAGDSDIWQFSWAGALPNHNPRFDGKLTGCTA